MYKLTGLPSLICYVVCMLTKRYVKEELMLVILHIIQELKKTSSMSKNFRCLLPATERVPFPGNKNKNIWKAVEIGRFCHNMHKQEILFYPVYAQRVIYDLMS